MFAASRGYTDDLSVLLSSMTPLDVANSIQDVFLEACKGGHIDTLQLLVQKHGAVLDHSILMAVAKSNDVRIMEFLVALSPTAFQSTIKQADKDGFTALHVCKNEAILQLLLDHGADVNVQSSTTGETPLHCFVETGNLSLVKMIISKQADVNACTNQNNTPLMRAQTMEIAIFLIGEGANIHKANDIGETPLHIAILKGAAAVVELLIGLGANIDTPTKSGQTPLMYAERAGMHATEAHRLKNRKDIVRMIQTARVAVAASAVNSR